MTTLDALDAVLAEYELFEPELGHQLRTSPHVLALGLGRAQLAAWEATALTYLYGEANTATFTHVVKALALPEAVATPLLREQQPTRYDYYWNRDLSERVEHIHLEGPRLELRYSNRKGRYLLELVAPPLPPERQADALAWLSGAEALSGIARGQALSPDILAQFDLIPRWRDCQVGVSHRGQPALELGARFVARLLTVFPAYVLVLRGLGGETAIRACIQAELSQRQAEYAAVVGSLPEAPAEFWVAPDLPALPLPHEVEPDPGLGAHLPPAGFWDKLEHNELLADMLAKVYKNIPRKLAKLTQPRRW